MKPLLTFLTILIYTLSMNSLTAQEDSTETKESEQQQASETKQETVNKNWGILGMNVRGNKESPMSLNIVPWRSADHQQLDPEVLPGWQPRLVLLQPEAYRREVNAFLRARAKRIRTE